VSHTPKVKPYEADATGAKLSMLPGDEPASQAEANLPPPMEYPLAEARFLAERPANLIDLRSPRPRRLWTVGTGFAVFALLFTMGFLAYHAVRTVMDAYSWWAPSGVMLAALLTAAVGTGLVGAGRELLALRRQMRSLGTIRSARQEADRLMQSRSHDEGLAFAARVIAIYEDRADMAEAIRSFRQSVNPTLRDQEVIARLSTHVLRHLDEEARTAVGRALRDTAFISLASPNGLVDSLITLWRELKMLREIAAIYGLSPGLLQQWTLLRRVLSIAATSGMAQQAGDMAVQSLGGGLVGRLSANAADSLYTALRTARLGVYAMESCRPVAFAPEERGGMWTFLSKAAGSVFALLEGRGSPATGTPHSQS